MHSEFTTSEATQQKHQAYAVFSLIRAGASLANAMDGMGLTIEQLRSYLPEWNTLSSKQIDLESSINNKPGGLPVSRSPDSPDTHVNESASPAILPHRSGPL